MTATCPECGAPHECADAWCMALWLETHKINCPRVLMGVHR